MTEGISEHPQMSEEQLINYLSGVSNEQLHEELSRRSRLLQRYLRESDVVAERVAKGQQRLQDRHNQTPLLQRFISYRAAQFHPDLAAAKSGLSLLYVALTDRELGLFPEGVREDPLVEGVRSIALGVVEAAKASDIEVRHSDYKSPTSGVLISVNEGSTDRAGTLMLGDVRSNEEGLLSPDTLLSVEILSLDPSKNLACSYFRGEPLRMFRQSNGNYGYTKPANVEKATAQLSLVASRFR